MKARPLAMSACAVAALGLSLNAQWMPEPQPKLPWGPVDAEARSLARHGDTLFVGGGFSLIGPPTGSSVAVDPVGGTLIATAGVAGEVRFVIPDGRGGWFIGGQFHAPERPAVALARLHADGSFDESWRPPPIGSSQALTLIVAGEVAQDRLFVGGIFDQVGGQPRPGVAALDALTGALLPWRPGLARPLGLPPAVFALRHHGGNLYLGGFFNTIDGLPRQHLATVDVVTAQPGSLDLPASDLVRSFSVLGDTLYVGGNFRQLGYQERHGVAAIALSTGALLPWAPHVAGEVWHVRALPGRVFVGGDAFSTVNGQPRHGLAALDPASGALLPFDAQLSDGAGALAFAERGDVLYVGGGFQTAHGQRRRGAAAFDMVSGALQPWSPMPGRTVHALAVGDASVLLGGAFNSVGVVERNGFARLDMVSGLPLPPVASPEYPSALLRLGDVLIAATPAGLEAFWAATMEPLPWRQHVDGVVLALATDGARLFVGGLFSEIAGVPRGNLAAFDLSTGSLTSWAPIVDGPIFTIAVDGGVAFVGGQFRTLPGYGRGSGAAFHAITGEVLSWDPQVEGVIQTLVAMPDRVIVGGLFDQLGRVPRAGIATVDRSRGAVLNIPPFDARPTWVAGSRRGTLLLGGRFLSVDQAARTGVAALGAANGALLPWAPDLPRVGWFSGPQTDVVSMDLADHRLVVGGAFWQVNGRPAANLAVFPIARPGAPRALRATVTPSGASLSWAPGSAPQASSYLVEVGTTTGGQEVGSFPVSTTGVSGTLAPGTYFARVRGVAFSGAGETSSEVVLTVPPTAGPPLAPSGLSAIVEGRAVTLTWAAAAGNAQEYVVEVGSAAGLSDILVFPTATLDTRLATPAPPGHYFVRVRAANASGLSPPSNEVVVDVPSWEWAQRTRPERSRHSARPAQHAFEVPPEDGRLHGVGRADVRQGLTLPVVDGAMPPTREEGRVGAKEQPLWPHDGERRLEHLLEGEPRRVLHPAV